MGTEEGLTARQPGRARGGGKVDCGLRVDGGSKNKGRRMRGQCLGDDRQVGRQAGRVTDWNAAETITHTCCLSFPLS